MRAQARTTVAAPVTRVWAVLSDHEGMSNWAPGMKASLVRPGDPERNGVGAQRRLQPAPFLPPFVEEITAFEPDRRLSYRAVSGIPLRNYAGEVELRSVGEGTEITYRVSADNRIPGAAAVLANVLLFAFKRQINRAA
ncbi:SRPBCC family protein [Mycobacterium sp. pUA109]|uniref:SRPBCC family protein n=1 Tax=Mycobacterium sp. pUA109 TaxID=3238982 RepID=UPI00351B20F8